MASHQLYEEFFRLPFPGIEPENTSIENGSIPYNQNLGVFDPLASHQPYEEFFGLPASGVDPGHTVVEDGNGHYDAVLNGIDPLASHGHPYEEILRLLASEFDPGNTGAEDGNGHYDQDWSGPGPSTHDQDNSSQGQQTTGTTDNTPRPSHADIDALLSDQGLFKDPELERAWAEIVQFLPDPESLENNSPGRIIAHGPQRGYLPAAGFKSVVYNRLPYNDFEDRCLKKFLMEVLAEPNPPGLGYCANRERQAREIRARMRRHLRGFRVDWQRSEGSINKQWERIRDSSTHAEKELPQPGDPDILAGDLPGRRVIGELPGESD